jgi:flagellar basal body-associated protein FliL
MSLPGAAASQFEITEATHPDTIERVRNFGILALVAHGLFILASISRLERVGINYLHAFWAILPLGGIVVFFLGCRADKDNSKAESESRHSPLEQTENEYSELVANFSPENFAQTQADNQNTSLANEARASENQPKQTSKAKAIVLTSVGCGLFVVGIGGGMGIFGYLALTDFIRFSKDKSGTNASTINNSQSSDERVPATHKRVKSEPLVAVVDDEVTGEKEQPFGGAPGPTDNQENPSRAFTGPGLLDERKAGATGPTNKSEGETEVEAEADILRAAKDCEYFNSPFYEDQSQISAVLSGTDSDPSQGKVGTVIVYYDIRLRACRKIYASAWTLSVHHGPYMVWNANRHPSDLSFVERRNRWHKYVAKLVGARVIIELSGDTEAGKGHHIYDYGGGI